MGIHLGQCLLIRPAEVRDIPDLVRMAAQFMAAAQGDLPVDRDYLDGSIRRQLASPAHLVLVKEAGGAAVGVFCAAAGRSLWSPVAVAEETGFWIDPAHRGGMTAVRILRAYVGWASSMGCVRAHIRALQGRSLDRLYARIGFVPGEITYCKVL